MKKKQMSESYLIGSILALVGGFLDTYTYVARGHVFANAQTGNIVLLGVNIATGNFTKIFYYLNPILSFVLGVIISDFIRQKFKDNKQIHWRQIVIIFEFVTLCIVSIMPMGSLDMLANCMVSFVCSLQVESFRKLNGNPFATTMCTGNLRSGTERLYRYKTSGDKVVLNECIQYYGIILFFIVGAAMGAILTHIFMAKAVLIACSGLALAFVLLFISNKIKR